MRKVLGIYNSSRPHWVGDGFPVRTIFSQDSLGRHVSPFLMLDYAAPTTFEPAARRAASGSIRIVDSRQSRSSTRANSSIATPQAPAVASVPATCSG